MNSSDATAAHGHLPKQQLHDGDNKHSNDPLSSKRPMLPFAANPTHDPEDPLRHALVGHSNKFESLSDSDTHVGDVADIQNASKRPTSREPTSRKKLTTSQAAIIFITNEVGIGMLSLPSALNVLGFFPGILCIIVMGMLSLYTAYNLIQSDWGTINSNQIWGLICI